MTESPRNQEIKVTPEMVKAGKAVLREAFGGETEGNNRFVDFEEVVRRLWAAARA